MSTTHIIVPREQIESLLNAVNTIATLSLKSERYSKAIAVKEALRAMLIAAPAKAQPVQEHDHVEPLKGWKLNHVQFVRGSGTAQIGYLDPEDDRFSPLVTIDTGLYYQPDHAHPLAIAILDALKDAPPPQAPLTADQVFASDEFMHLNASLLQLSMPQLMLLVRAMSAAFRA